MAESSMLWNTNGTGDGIIGGYSQQRWYDMFRNLFTRGGTKQGVIWGVGGQLWTSTPEFDNTHITIQPGAAIIHGFYYENTAEITYTIDPKPSTTALMICLEANWSTQTVRAKQVWAADGDATVPVPINNPGTVVQFKLSHFFVGPSGISGGGGGPSVFCYFSTKFDKDSLDWFTLSLNKMNAMVPGLRKRRGGNAEDWSEPGTQDFATSGPNHHRGHIVVGSVRINGNYNHQFTTMEVAYPLAPDGVNLIWPTKAVGWANPLLFVNCYQPQLHVVAQPKDRVSFYLHIRTIDQYPTSTLTVDTVAHWCAIGPYGDFISINDGDL